MRTCKICKTKFEPTNSSVQMVCGFDCSIKYVCKQKEKKWQKEKKVLKEKLKTTSDYLKEVQVVFNKWIRLRDKGKPCISCGNPAKKENAGHYRSVGSSPQLRFEPLNNNLQCEYCNTFLHGNLINYRINLIKKIGLDKVEWLEQEHPPKHYSIPELILLKEEYKEKIRQMK